jgi:helix-turn-helix protein
MSKQVDVLAGANSPAPLLLDVAAAAAIVGVGVGVIRGWAADGLPFVRAGRGGRKMFQCRDIERWLERLKESAV